MGDFRVLDRLNLDGKIYEVGATVTIDDAAVYEPLLPAPVGVGVIEPIVYLEIEIDPQSPVPPLPPVANELRGADPALVTNAASEPHSGEPAQVEGVGDVVADAGGVQPETEADAAPPATETEAVAPVGESAAATKRSGKAKS